MFIYYHKEKIKKSDETYIKPRNEYLQRWLLKIKDKKIICNGIDDVLRSIYKSFIQNITYENQIYTLTKNIIKNLEISFKNKKDEFYAKLNNQHSDLKTEIKNKIIDSVDLYSVIVFNIQCNSEYNFDYYYSTIIQTICHIFLLTLLIEHRDQDMKLYDLMYDVLHSLNEPKVRDKAKSLVDKIRFSPIKSNTTDTDSISENPNTNFTELGIILKTLNISSENCKKL